MKKRCFALAASAALALVLASPSSSSAIIIFGPRGASYGYGGFGYGYPGYYGAGYGVTYGYAGASWSPYSYVGYGTTYGPYRYTYSPGYSGVVPSAWVTAPTSYVAFYPPSFPRSAPAAAPPPPVGYYAAADNSATVQVELPADAKLWFDGEPTKQAGAMRTFTTPALESGHNYHYDVKARWEENGKPVERTRRVEVYAGARVTVDFNQPSK
jgi:uncharacterized protein (TIGR03000 family)